MTVILRTMLAGIFRDAHTLGLTIIFPLALLIGLGLYFDDPAYSERLVVGVLTTNVLLGSSMVTAFNVMAQRNRGIYKLLRATPFPTSAFVCAMTGARTALSMVVSAIVLLTGLLMFGVKPAAAGIGLLAAILLVGSICFTAIGFFAANLSRDEGNVNLISNLIGFPMLFTSEAFYSMQGAPDWLQTAARCQPFHYFVRASAEALRESGPSADVWLSLAMLAGFAVVALAAAVLTFRWDPEGVSTSERKGYRAMRAYKA